MYEEKLTLQVDINIPDHEARVTTPLFLNSKKELIKRDGAKCWICGNTAEQSGNPLESHHYPIERSLANMIDWELFKSHCLAGDHGIYAEGFDWGTFNPLDPYSFVDDQTVNGVILCKEHHVGKDAGIHCLPHPIWIAQKYAKEGYQFSPTEVIHHG
jgi:hypothetical protein